MQHQRPQGFIANIKTMLQATTDVVVVTAMAGSKVAEGVYEGADAFHKVAKSTSVMADEYLDGVYDNVENDKEARLSRLKRDFPNMPKWRKKEFEHVVAAPEEEI